MTLFVLFFQFLTVFSTKPQTLILKDGRTLPIKGDFALKQGVFTFVGEHNGYFRLPARFINFPKTFLPAPKPVSKPRGRELQRKIPWHHPQFLDKTETVQTIRINNDNLKLYSQAAPFQRSTPPPPEEGELEDKDLEDPDLVVAAATNKH